MTVSLHNRRKLEDAMARLIDGTVKAPDAKLTWKNVAAVAGVSKATADRAVDLRDEFRHRLAEQAPVMSSPRQPGTRVRGNIEEELGRLRQENAGLRTSTKVLYSLILALVQESQRLARHGQGRLPG